MKRLIKGTASFLTVLMLLFIVPLSPARAEEGAERWELEMIRAGFSDQIDLNGQGIRVGVIDSGISPLSCFDALEPGRDYTGEDSTEDAYGHGTFISGIIAASGADSGFRGVAPEVALIPLRCFSSNKNGELKSVAAAIYDAVDEFHCDVISLSFGQKQDDRILRNAVNYAVSHGVVVVAAAGNSGSSALTYPAAYKDVIAVSAVDRSGEIALDASRNRSVDLAAPGVKVMGPEPEGGYVTRSGSSFAVAFVTGAAALLLNADGSLTSKQVCDILCETAADAGEPGWDECYGWGILDVEAALRRVLAAKSPCWLTAPEAKAGGVEITAYNFGDEALEGCCRLGLEALPLHLEPGESAALRVPPQTAAAACAVWRTDTSGGEVCVSNVREWTGGPAFSDVPADAWFADAVMAAAGAGLMVGLPDGSFDPSGVVTRAMFVTVLYRFCGSPEAEESTRFADVAPEDWYAPAVSWAEGRSLISGVEPDRFAPGLPLTREAMAVILRRMSAGEGRGESGLHISDYSDADSISAWALEGMEYCVAAGLMQGVSAAELSPQGVLTRAALAVLLTRLEG